MSRETPEQRAERILAELRAATSEAAGVLKDLQRTMASARAQVDEYAHDEISRELVKACNRTLDEAVRVCQEHEAKVIERVIGYSALIEANFGREPLIREAAARIEALVMKEVEVREAYQRATAPGVVISVCDRPHAD